MTGIAPARPRRAARFAPAATSDAAGREWSGRFSYVERIALPPEAVLVVAASDGAGHPLGGRILIGCGGAPATRPAGPERQVVVVGGAPCPRAPGRVCG